MAQDHNGKHDRPTHAPSPAEGEAGCADPLPADVSTLIPENLGLPGRGTIDVRGRSVDDVIHMIRDAFRAPKGGDRNAPSGGAAPTRESTVEWASEVSSESPPEDALFTDVTAPGGWIIMGCGDEDGERGFVAEGAVRPSKPSEGKP